MLELMERKMRRGEEEEYSDDGRDDVIFFVVVVVLLIMPLFFLPVKYRNPIAPAPKEVSIATIDGIERLAKLCVEFF